MPAPSDVRRPIEEINRRRQLHASVLGVVHRDEHVTVKAVIHLHIKNGRECSGRFQALLQES